MQWRDKLRLLSTQATHLCGGRRLHVNQGLILYCGYGIGDYLAQQFMTSGNRSLNWNATNRDEPFVMPEQVRTYAGFQIRNDEALAAPLTQWDWVMRFEPTGDDNLYAHYQEGPSRVWLPHGLDHPLIPSQLLLTQGRPPPRAQWPVGITLEALMEAQEESRRSRPAAPSRPRPSPPPPPPPPRDWPGDQVDLPRMPGANGPPPPAPPPPPPPPPAFQPGQWYRVSQDAQTVHGLRGLRGQIEADQSRNTAPDTHVTIRFPEINELHNVRRSVLIVSSPPDSLPTPPVSLVDIAKQLGPDASITEVAAVSDAINGKTPETPEPEPPVIGRRRKMGPL